MKSFELNLDGLVGPTHNYAGLSPGNIASSSNSESVSNPKAAALQGLEKMKFLHDKGLKQGLLPPQIRPDLSVLRKIGLSGSDDEVVAQAFKQVPQLALKCFSAASMWTANAATVSPSADTLDGKVHFTAANLHNNFHRAIEDQATAKVLRVIFNNPKYFSHHSPLPQHIILGDEGAANHTRFCSDYHQKGVEFFVYGRDWSGTKSSGPVKFPARQSLQASQAVARLHQLTKNTTVYAQQNPQMIDSGVFHNDVISVGNKNIFFYYQDAFLEMDKTLAELQEKMGNTKIHFIKIGNNDLSVKEIVNSYLFNSQILSLDNNKNMLLVPMECYENKNVKNILCALKSDIKNPITDIHYMDVKQSMRNGGGPACLRLRVALTEEELSSVHPGILFSDSLHQELISWINTYYRDRLTSDDFQDPLFLHEIKESYTKLNQILQL